MHRSKPILSVERRGQSPDRLHDLDSHDANDLAPESGDPTED